MSFAGHIVLVGPIGVGKSSTAEVIAADLGIEHVMLDVADDHLTLVGWSEEAQRKAYARSGGIEVLRYRGKFAVPWIERLLAEHPSAVLDCGGVDLVVVSEEDRRDTKRQLEDLGLNHIAAIIPFETVEETESYLAAHNRLDKWNTYLIRHPFYTEIAHRVFYTHGGPLEEVAEQVVAWVRE